MSEHLERIEATGAALHKKVKALCRQAGERKYVDAATMAEIDQFMEDAHQVIFHFTEDEEEQPEDDEHSDEDEPAAEGSATAAAEQAVRDAATDPVGEQTAVDPPASGEPPQPPPGLKQG